MIKTYHPGSAIARLKPQSKNLDDLHNTHARATHNVAQADHLNRETKLNWHKKQEASLDTKNKLNRRVAIDIFNGLHRAVLKLIRERLLLCIPFDGTSNNASADELMEMASFIPKYKFHNGRRYHFNRVIELGQEGHNTEAKTLYSVSFIADPKHQYHMDYEGDLSNHQPPMKVFIKIEDRQTGSIEHVFYETDALTVNDFKNLHGANPLRALSIKYMNGECHNYQKDN